ncbi:hypothetical protein VVD49_18535 [Uliginosibacterium sp. H3]|uniref:Uncharacterized protein n=1 Tax=Uliginosibacterium silvisoli TaxID=3114758 RepID=A0ABU6K784_9RHOO|nr:hypothetical protein [Uliginosibacterium sp. H3]
MQLDPIVTRRFSELRQKAEATIAAKVVEFRDQQGTQQQAIGLGHNRH